MSVTIDSSSPALAHHLTLSQDRVEPGSYMVPPAKFPKTCSTTPADPDELASGVINKLNDSLKTQDYKTLANQFLGDGYWRDHLCLSWDFRTFKGQENILNFLSKGCRLSSVEIDRSSPIRAPHVGPIDGFGEVTGIEFFIKVDTQVGRGRGIVRLAEDKGIWKICTFFTSLTELKGHEESVDHRRPKGTYHGEKTDRRNWQERRIDDINFEGKDPSVVIIGISHGPLTISSC